MPSFCFTKYHGLGNDFIVVDSDAPWRWTAREARELCDRHRGIGADGVLLVGPKSETTRASMRVLNADGSEPEMCGNGLRCVALHLALADSAEQASFRVATGAGELPCLVTRTGTSATVEIAMGRARLLDPLQFACDGRALHFERVSTGNPHAIVFDQPLDELAIDSIAPRVSGAIEGGVNVEFVEQLGPRALRVVVWERGVGRTLACGTGAVASVAAAAARGRVPFGERVSVELPGGVLEIAVSEGFESELTGPAQRVFAGEVEQ